MKKLLFLLAAIFMLAPTVYAEYALDEVFCEFPETLYTPPKVSFFAEPELDEILYNRFEQEILSNAYDGALHNDIYISIRDIGTDFYTNDATYNVNYLLNIYSNVVYNHPEIGNLVTAILPYVENGGSTHLVGFEPAYREIYNEATYQALATAAQKKAYLARTHNVEAYNQAVKYAYSKAISPDMTEDWQKLLSIHDYIVDTVTYSPIVSDGISDVIKAYNNYTNYLVYNPYSVFVGEKNSVCQGYALAFKLLCDMAGIECGYALSSNHIWNIVALGDNYYHIDATWDDPTAVMVSNGTEAYKCTSPSVYHRHFLRSDEDSTTLHASEGAWSSNMPEATDSKLYSSLLYGHLSQSYLNTCLRWAEGSFWFEKYKYILDSAAGRLYYVPSGDFFRITSSGISNVSKADYLPTQKLSAKMYNIFQQSDTAYVAIDGTANSRADLYAAVYTDDGVFLDAYKSDITFNSAGEAVAEFPAACNRLFLFKDGSMEPLAYTK